MFLVGQPVLIGWVYQYEHQMLMIFAVTLGALLLALALYMRNTVGVLTPIITSATAGIWAFGFVGWLDISIEPLLMVVPLLLTARSFSHSVQFTERFYEVYAETQDRRRAAEITMMVMMAPSVLGIFTDILGIVVVAFAPIPAMVRHAIFCGMWAVWLIPTGVVLISLLLATLPAPRNTRRLTGNESGGAHRKLGSAAGRDCIPEHRATGKGHQPFCCSHFDRRDRRCGTNQDRQSGGRHQPVVAELAVQHGGSCDQCQLPRRQHAGDRARSQESGRS